MKEIALAEDQQADITAYFLLFLAASGWAVGTIIVKTCIGQVSAANLLMIRSLIAGIVIFLAAPKKILAMNRQEAKTGLILGLYISVAYYFGIISIQYTSASKSGFLASLSVLFVPLAGILIKRSWPSRWLVISVLLSLAGLQLIAGMNGGSFNLGDALGVGCALGYTAYIIQLDRLGAGQDVFILSFLAVVVMGLTGLVGAAGFDGFDWTGMADNIWPLLLLGIFSTGLTTLFQIQAQKTASPESVGIILLAEPIMGLFLAVLILQETVLPSGLVGSGLILAALGLAVLKKV